MHQLKATILSIERPLPAQTIHESMDEACRLPYHKGVRITGTTEKTIRVEVARHNTKSGIKLSSSVQADGSMLIFRRRD